MNKRLWVISLVLSVFLFIPLNEVAAYAQSNNSEIKSNPEAEQIILELVAEGEIADLSFYFPNKEDRVISAEFLKNLLTGEVITIPDKGVFIKNVTIVDALILTNEVIPNTSITECEFINSVNIQGAKIESLSFSYCTFAEEAKFNKTIIYESVYFDNAQFNQSVDFSLMSVGNNIDFNHAQFNTPQTVDFSSMTIGGNALFYGATFKGPLYFAYTRINRALNFSETQFNSAHESYFNSIAVGDAAVFSDAILLGPIDFGHARIGANLDFSRAKFNTRDRLRFYSMDISGSIIFQDVAFLGPVFFLYTEVGSLMDFSRSQFTSQFIVSFSSLKIEHGMNFEDVTFNGPVTFTYIDSNGSLNFNQTKFLNSTTTATFTNLNVDGGFSLSNASVSGGIIFNNTNIKNNLIGEDINFLNPDAPINIRRTEAQSLLLNFANSTNAVDITNCSFLDYRLGGAKQSVNILSLNLSGTKITQSFILENIAIGSFIGSNLMSYGTATIRDIDIDKRVNLSFANFNNLILQNVSWPKVEGEFDLDGFNYNQIIPGESLNDNNWRELIELIDAANYNVALYRNLESYFSEYGHSDWADEVLIEQKRRERSDLLKWYSLKWWWSLFLDGFILYGKRPQGERI